MAIPEDKEGGSEVAEIKLEDESKIYDDIEEGEREQEKENEEDATSIQGKMSSEELEAVTDASSNPGCSLDAAADDDKDAHDADEKDSDTHESALDE